MRRAIAGVLVGSGVVAAVVAGVSQWTADSPAEAIARYAASATAGSGRAIHLEASMPVERGTGRATYRLHWQRPSGALDQVVVVQRQSLLGGLDTRWTVLDSGSEAIRRG